MNPGEGSKVPGSQGGLLGDMEDHLEDGVNGRADVDSTSQTNLV
jgi:hypothetical protein